MMEPEFEGLFVVSDLHLGGRPGAEVFDSTRLVIDVMNPIKRGLPFVDLLKPEDSAVPNILLSLDRERRGLGIGQAVARALAIAKTKRDIGRRRRNDELGARRPHDEPESDTVFVPEIC